jgi:hypothetical protein
MTALNFLQAHDPDCDMLISEIGELIRPCNCSLSRKARGVTTRFAKPALQGKRNCLIITDCRECKKCVEVVAGWFCRHPKADRIIAKHLKSIPIPDWCPKMAEAETKCGTW